MRKKVVIGAIVVLLLLIGGLTGGSFYMLDYSLTPTVKGDPDRESAFRFMYKEYPFLQPWVDSLRRAHALRDTFIVNPEGVRLHALYASAPKPTKKTAVIVHGYTDNAIRMLMIGYMFNHDLGFNILLPDLQFHGESGGKAIQMGWKDRLDVMQWMDVANEEFGDSTQMVLHGISMGAATVMMISGESLPGYVKAIIEDCGYTSVWDQFAKELEESFNLPTFPLLYTTSWLCEQKYGWNFQEASSLKQIAKCRLPMLFIHGNSDSYVPTQMAFDLYRVKPWPKEMWISQGAKHAASYRVDKKNYTREVNSFFEKHVLGIKYESTDFITPDSMSVNGQIIYY